MAKTGRPIIYGGLNDKEFLIHKYVQEQWSTVKIAKLFGCDPKAVNYRLRKYGIETRSLSNSHMVDGFKFVGNYNVLYGSLLGDGCLLKRSKKTGSGSASFSKGNIGYDHICFVGREILGNDPIERIKEYQPKLSNRSAFKFTTRMCDEFLAEYNRWYPEGVKIVPKDLVLNKEIVLHWFMDDGHSCWKHKRRNSVCVGFSTESFTELDCDYLTKELDKFGINAYLGKSHGGYGHKIFIRGRSVKDFFNFIGECPKEIGSMNYKWKIPTGEYHGR